MPRLSRACRSEAAAIYYRDIRDRYARMRGDLPKAGIRLFDYFNRINGAVQTEPTRVRHRIKRDPHSCDANLIY